MKRRYQFTDYTGYEPGRGGHTPTYAFTLGESQLSLSFDSDGSSKEAPTSHAAAVETLRERLRVLNVEAEQLRTFLALALTTTEYESEG